MGIKYNGTLTPSPIAPWVEMWKSLTIQKLFALLCFLLIQDGDQQYHHTYPSKSLKFLHPTGKPCQQLHPPNASRGLCSGRLGLMKLGLQYPMSIPYWKKKSEKRWLHAFTVLPCKDYAGERLIAQSHGNAYFSLDSLHFENKPQRNICPRLYWFARDCTWTGKLINRFHI